MLDRSDIHRMANQLKVWSSWYYLLLHICFYLLLNLTGCSSQQMVYHLKSFFSVNHSAAVKIHQPVKSPAIAMKSSQALSVVDQKKYQVAESGGNYIVTQPVVKYYQPTRLLVKSSPQPIDLGPEMFPYMELSDLRAFMSRHQIRKASDTPAEVYLYNWVDGAQGAMIFQTGCVVDQVNPDLVSSTAFRLVQLPALKVCSILYIGPFPYQKNSGWGQIDWERRAAEAGYKYTEVLYRELYHRYDFGGNNQHVTEIEISIH